ncbi:MAG TPA: hypothetical protein VE955_04430, partial [Candidatus Dormibacteraeota bacterium]|nr:hypothetical protein [Candidatus Dormibacteraeota bacterium]
TVPPGSSGTSTITVTGVNGFSGSITFSASIAPTGPTYSFSPMMVPISGPSATSILTIFTTASTPSGMYTVTIDGNNGTVARTTTVSVTVTVPNFAITTSPGSLNITQNSTATSTITLSSLNGFSGTLNLTATVSPPGPVLSLSTASVTLSSGGTAQSTLTVSAVGGSYNPVATGTYTIMVTVTNGTLSHSKTLQATVNPATAPAPPLPLAVLAGAGVIIAAAVAVTVFLVRRRTVSK